LVLVLAQFLEAWVLLLEVEVELLGVEVEVG
jgi:hypothetical protein